MGSLILHSKSSVWSRLSRSNQVYFIAQQQRGNEFFWWGESRVNSLILLPNTICNQFCAVSVFLGQRWLIIHSTFISSSTVLVSLPIIILTILCSVYFALLLGLQVSLLSRLCFVAFPGLLPAVLSFWRDWQEDFGTRIVVFSHPVRSHLFKKELNGKEGKI